MKAGSCNKDFEFRDFLGHPSFGRNFRAIVSEAGSFWVGPLNCRLATLGGRVVGFSIARDDQALLLFAGPVEKIPMTNGSIVAYAKLVHKFEEDLVAGVFNETRRSALCSRKTIKSPHLT
jgi:hypothetical protein